MKRKLTSALVAGLFAVGAVAAPASAATTAPAPVENSSSAISQSPHHVPDWLKECDYKNFKDNKHPKSKFYFSVRWMQCMDITEGYNNGKYGKKRDITRGESMAFIYRYMDPDFTPWNDEPFRDIDEDHTFYEAVAWGKEMRIVQGYNNGTFGDREEITRGEFATMLFRNALNIGLDMDQEELLEQLKKVKKFRDVDPESAHYRAIQVLSALSVARGYNDDSFRPDETITRGEVAELTFRINQVMERLDLR